MNRNITKGLLILVEMISILNELDNKSKRKLKNSWEILCNPKNYLIPETLDEFKAYFLKPRIKLKQIECYLNKKAKKELYETIDIIFSIDELRNTLSFDTLFQTILEMIQEEVENQISGVELAKFEVFFEKLSTKLLSNRSEYMFYYEISGISLEGIDEINFGRAKLFKFSEDYKVKLLNQIDRDISEKQKELYNKFIDENFLNKICINYSIVSDHKKGEELSNVKIREILNYWRFILCLLIYERIFENLIKIRNITETFTQKEAFMTEDKEKGSLVISCGRGRQTLESFPITLDRIKELESSFFLQDFIEFSNKDQKSDLEGLIHTAIYWTGEAQDEFDREIAFLKYWTALECIFSHRSGKITDAIAKGVSILITLSSYAFVPINDINSIYSSMKRLYSVRSKIIHRGSKQIVKNSELVDICKFTCWTILSLFDLRNRGYQNINQIDKETDRLYSICQVQEGS